MVRQAHCRREGALIDHGVTREPNVEEVAAARQSARARLDLERQTAFDTFIELGAARVQTRFAGRLAGLPPVGAFEQRLFDLWLASVTEQLSERSHDKDKDKGNDLFEHARALIELTRSLTVTQRQTSFDVFDSFEDDDFTQRKMTILVSGLCNCEMSNYIVWAGLRKLGHLAYFFETGLRDQMQGSHLLLYVVGPQGGAFVDAWSELPCFHLSECIPKVPDVRGRELADRYGHHRPPGVPELHEFAHFGLQTHGVYPAEAFRAGHIRSGPRDDNHPDAAAALRCADEAEPTPVEPLWRDYLVLRHRHLEGKLEQPASAYQEFAARAGLPKSLQDVAAALAKRQAS